MSKKNQWFFVVAIFFAYTTGAYISFNTPIESRTAFLQFFAPKILESLAKENIFMFYLKTLAIGLISSMPVALTITLATFFLKNRK